MAASSQRVLLFRIFSLWIAVPVGQSHSELFCRTCGATIATLDQYTTLPASALASRQNVGASRSLIVGEKEINLLQIRGKGDSRVEVIPLKGLQTIKEGGKLTRAQRSHNAEGSSHIWGHASCSQCSTHLGWILQPIRDTSEHEHSAEAQQCDMDADSCVNTEHAQPIATNPPKKSEQCHSDGIAKGMCLERKAKYWTVSWCHSEEIRQFHRVGKVTDPNYSLGKFNPSHSQEESAHHFVDGQHCDETGTGRSTVVRFVCCKVGAKKPKLISFEEIRTCEYEIVVCVPRKQEKKTLSNTHKKTLSNMIERSRKAKASHLAKRGQDVASKKTSQATESGQPTPADESAPPLYALAFSELISSEELKWVESTAVLNTLGF